MGEAFKLATENLDKGINKLPAAAEAALDLVELIAKKYSKAEIIKAAGILGLDSNVADENDPFSGVEHKKLYDAYNAIIAIYDDPAYASLFGEKCEDIMAEVNAAYKSYNEFSATVKTAHTEVKLGDIQDYEIDSKYVSLKASGYTWSEKIQAATAADSVKKPEPNTKKYISNDNKIVHETFDNGKEFLLNFNDYSVIVKINGTDYTLEAYGYVVISSAKN